MADVQEAFAAEGGNPDEVASVLCSISVVTNAWRYFAYGEPAPLLKILPTQLIRAVGTAVEASKGKT